jgi:hypothetical protein
MLVILSAAEGCFNPIHKFLEINQRDEVVHNAANSLTQRSGS